MGRYANTSLHLQPLPEREAVAIEKLDGRRAIWVHLAQLEALAVQGGVLPDVVQTAAFRPPVIVEHRHELRGGVLAVGREQLGGNVVHQPGVAGEEVADVLHVLPDGDVLQDGEGDVNGHRLRGLE